MALYTYATELVSEYAQTLIQKYYSEFAAIGLSIDAVFALPTLDREGEATGPAITRRGTKIFVDTRITSLKERVLGRADIEINIDGEYWERSNKSERLALIDHALNTVELARDSDGCIKMDDHDRPKLTRVPPDRAYEWYDTVAKRHGTASVERKQSDLLISDSQDAYEFGFIADLARTQEAK